MQYSMLFLHGKLNQTHKCVILHILVCKNYTLGFAVWLVKSPDLMLRFSP